MVVVGCVAEQKSAVVSPTAIERPAPYPVPTDMGTGTLTWREVWLVDRSGRFQVQLLSEGQR